MLEQIQASEKSGSIEVLGQNLNYIRTGYRPKNYDANNELIDISANIKKLYDHVNLEIARLSYANNKYHQLSGNELFNDLKSKVNSIAEISNKVKSVERKITNYQKENITILGIFAAVVLAFTAGIAFSSSVLNNIAKVSIYRTVIISLIIGLIIVNLVFGLLYYLNQLVKEKVSLFPMLISNTIIVLFVIITILFWKFGIVEQRNKMIDSKVYPTEHLALQKHISIANTIKNCEVYCNSEEKPSYYFFRSG